ncbi:5,6-dimethylbenzimidazole synthase [Eilatimonas milleporae]|uniref:Cob(II)yrinic acid a,c-diamide reductase n=1 Tax=Eilatimonas milleporae TaxID=911205 RepID=A0A3M0CRI6_9PROT|nr:5,6-dimethylbenzimidazole synthase [Eilatimonas milleporae]RMB12098.1 cob(II)yrinic acid a,c-diamide reductase [Eilatimonas milleporae]
MKFTEDDFTVVTQVMRWRRDTRHFLTEPLPPDILARILSTVDMAPSVGNARPWRIVRVRDTDRRAAVASLFERANRAAAQEYEPETRADYLRLKLAGLRDAPEHLAVFTVPDPVEGRGLGRQTMPETVQYSTAMAVHTIWLAARALNVGVGWVSILDPVAAATALDVPGHWRLTAYLCLGWPERDDDRPLLDRTGWQPNTPTEILDR